MLLERQLRLPLQEDSSLPREIFMLSSRKSRYRM